MSRSGPISLCLRVGLRSEEHTSELQSRFDLVCRLLLEKKNQDVVTLPSRTGLGEGSLIGGDGAQHVVELCAAVTESTKIAAFQQTFRYRYIQVGLSEYN